MTAKPNSTQRGKPPQRKAPDRKKEMATKQVRESGEDGRAAQTGGGDVVCFTSGFHGFGFSAGVTHAYLVADRLPPEIVAGVSLGAVNAAAMRRCYVELSKWCDDRTDEKSGQYRDKEVARWAWFSKYIHEISNNPYKSVRESLPALIDFFSDRPPVRSDRESDSGPEEKRTRDDAVWQRVLQIKSGQWIARRRLSVRDVARTCVAYVRAAEPGYPGYRWWRRFIFAMLLIDVAFRFVLHAAFRVTWVNKRVCVDRVHPLRAIHRYEPVIGWGFQTFAWAIVASIGTAILVPLLSWVRSALNGDALDLSLLWFLSSLLALPLLVFIYRLVTDKYGRLLANMGIERSLVHDFYIMRQLRSLFSNDTCETDQSADGTHSCRVPRLLSVISSLRVGSSANYGDVRLPLKQGWSRETHVVDALRAAIALPPLLSPCRGPTGGIGVDSDIIDAAWIRQNPLPALFGYLKQNRALAYKMSVHREKGKERWRAEVPSIHVVYNVPIEPGAISPPNSGNCANIVDVGKASWRLAMRRDTRLEVNQTNFMSRLESRVWAAEGAPANGVDVEVFPLFVDEIAPSDDLNNKIRNRMAPSTADILKCVAMGCRDTLRSLYRDRIDEKGGDVSCSSLISIIAPERIVNGDTPGLREVCAQCTGRLKTSPLVDRTDYSPDVHNPEVIFPQLRSGRPRIVIAASGGVFRGSFHVGMAGALFAGGIKPDLVSGASVGTLLGGGIAAMFTSSREDAISKLNDMVRVFAEVDRRVALTVRIKRAFRDIGIRARGIRLSPARIRRLVRRGGRSDPGFAATGAPPELIDALADLFLVPQLRVRGVAAHFVSGHVDRAVHRFLGLLKEDALRRLDIEEELMGTALLEEVATTLLGFDGDGNGRSMRLQPYSAPDADKSIGIIATATDLVREKAEMFGCQKENAARSFDFVQAALASCAFPTVFAPRRASQVFPGVGDPAVRYGDGGIFDNLPILPALELLSYVQQHGAMTGTAHERLQGRNERPDLVIVGALDPDPSPDDPNGYTRAGPILLRAKELSSNYKIRSLEVSAEKIHHQIGRLIAASVQDDPDESYFDKIVDAAVLPIVPIDRQHLSGTFAFCKSMGLSEDRVYTAIAHGCFQTWDTFSEYPLGARRGAFADEVLRVLRSEEGGRRVPGIRPASTLSERPGECPFFVMRGKSYDYARIPCPFAQPEGSVEVHRACVRDEAHQQRFHKGTAARRSGVHGEPGNGEGVAASRELEV